jgi:oligopeptide/dipeptide ABC transporter ATP-binding protein
MPDDLLNVAGLTVSYGTGAAAVSAASLRIAPGEIVGLSGDSGSGKSTLGLALLGLARPPGRILAGRVMFAGADLLALPEAERRRRRGGDIGLIVQNPRGSLSPLHKVGAQIAAVLRAHRTMPAAEARSRSIALLRGLGMNDPERRAQAYPHEISGGMAQRVLIAMALGSGPRLLVADEPSSGLDVTIQAQFLDELWHTARRTASAVLLITQDLGIVANYCDRVLVMERGRIVADAPTRDFFAAPQDAYSRAVLGLRHEHPPERTTDAGLLTASNLTRTFAVRGTSKRVQAVQSVSFEIGRAETLGLVGESGSGKTTVGRCLLRLIEPDSGDILFDGARVTGAAPAELRRLRRRMQIVFQDPLDALDPRWTIGDIIAEGLEKRDPARVADLLRLVDLDPATARLRPKALSGGAQQRVGIARAIAADPALIVLDEPTSALTPLARVGIVRLLRDLQVRLGMSYLFISHDLNTVEQLSHRVAVMYLGQIVEIGTRAQIFASPLHPYSKALLSAHLAADPTRRRVDRALPPALSGEIPSPINLPLGCYLAGRCPDVRDSCRTQPQTLQNLPEGRAVRCAPAFARAAAKAPHLQEMPS